jgi:hypothetical protein
MQQECSCGGFVAISSLQKITLSGEGWSPMIYAFYATGMWNLQNTFFGIVRRPKMCGGGSEQIFQKSQC